MSSIVHKISTDLFINQIFFGKFTQTVSPYLANEGSGKTAALCLDRQIGGTATRGKHNFAVGIAAA